MFTQLGLILFAGQQSLTRAQVAKLPPVAAFRLSRPVSIRRAGLAPQDGTPEELNSPPCSILLRVEPAHRSRRPKRNKYAGLPSPLRKRAHAGRRPGPHARPGNTASLKKQGEASCSGEVSEAEPCPENPSNKSTSRRSVFRSGAGFSLRGTLVPPVRVQGPLVGLFAWVGSSPRSRLGTSYRPGSAACPMPEPEIPFPPNLRYAISSLAASFKARRRTHERPHG